MHINTFVDKYHFIEHAHSIQNVNNMFSRKHIKWDFNKSKKNHMWAVIKFWANTHNNYANREFTQRNDWYTWIKNDENTRQRHGENATWKCAIFDNIFHDLNLGTILNGRYKFWKYHSKLLEQNTNLNDNNINS